MKKQLIVVLITLTIGILVSIYVPSYIIEKRVEKSKIEFNTKIDNYFNNKNLLVNSAILNPNGDLYTKKEMNQYLDTTDFFRQALIKNTKYKKYYIPEVEVFKIEVLSKKDSFFNYATYSSSIIAVSADEFQNVQTGSYSINGSTYIPIFQKQRYYTIKDVESYYKSAYDYLLNEIIDNSNNYYLVPSSLSLNRDNVKQKLEKFENEFYAIKMGYPTEDSSRWNIGAFTTTKISSLPYSLSVADNDFHLFYEKSEEPLKIYFKNDYYNKELEELKDNFHVYFYICFALTLIIWLATYLLRKKN